MSLLGIMRSYVRWRTIPAIIVSAHASQAELLKARALGVVHIFQKANFKLEELAKAVDDVTRKERAAADRA